MRSPQMAGVEPPMPGILSFQATFFDSLHSVGRPVSLLMPSFSGPRHCGQLPATARPEASSRKEQAKRVGRAVAGMRMKSVLEGVNSG